MPEHTSTTSSGSTESSTGRHTLSYFVSYLCCLARHLTLLRLLVQPMWRARVSLTTLQPREVQQALGTASSRPLRDSSLKSTTCVRTRRDLTPTVPPVLLSIYLQGHLEFSFGSRFFIYAKNVRILLDSQQMGFSAIIRGEVYMFESPRRSFSDM